MGNSFKLNVKNELTREQRDRILEAIADIALESNDRCSITLIGVYNVDDFFNGIFHEKTLTFKKNDN